MYKLELDFKGREKMYVNMKVRMWKYKFILSNFLNVRVLDSYLIRILIF